MALKEPFKTALHTLAAGIFHRPQFQPIAAELIAYRQRFTATFFGSPPTFKIHRPDLIEPLCSAAAAQSAPFDHHPITLTHLSQPRSLQASFKTTLPPHSAIPPHSHI